MARSQATPASSQIITLTRMLEEREGEIERLSAEIDKIKQVEFPRRVQKVADVWRAKVDALRAENEKLRAEVEAMREQEPVAWFEKSSDLDAWFLAYSCNPKAETKPLYLAPGAQTAPNVPDGWPTDDMVSAFAAVFNVLNQKATFGPAFRAALAAAPERDNVLHELATRYHTECEAYDKTVCTGPMGKDGIMPANPKEMALINRNAHAVRRRLTEEATREGVEREELARAISKWRGSLPNAR